MASAKRPATEKPVRRRRGRFSLPLGTLLAAAIVVAAASADNLITQDLVTDGNATATRLGGGNAEIYVAQTGGACDANGDRINVTSNQSWLTIASPGYVNVTGCGNANAQSIAYSVTSAAPLGGVARVTGSENVDDSQINTGPNSDFDVTVVPRAPSNLGSPSKTASSIDLSWTLSPDDADLSNYQLETASSGGGPWSLLAAPATGATTYTHSGLSASTQYCYRLAARYQAGGSVGTLLSSFTGTLCVTTKAANTPPSVSVTGVTHGASYEAGSVPAAGCSVTDAEDGPSAFAATLSAISGPLSAYGLGSQTASCSYTDGGGLSANASATYSIVDTTDPLITFVSRTPAANANGWNNTNVTVNWSCSDGGSGVVSSTIDETISSEGANQSATGTCEDHAGNTASDTQSGINIDKTAPTASASALPAPNGNGWNNTNVTVSFSGSDVGGSGIDFCAADVVLNTEGSGQSASGTCTDEAGNVSALATASGINIDKTAPTASASALPSPNVNGWNNSDVTVSWNWADNAGGSGIDAGNCPTSSTSSGEGTILLSASCKDLAGNEANASHTVKVDKTAPTASASALPAPNGNGWNNTNVTVSFSGSDVGGSGIDFCAADVVLNTEGSGQSASGTCTDEAGNVSALATASGINIDKTAPTASASALPAPNGNGWNNTNVTVSFSGSDVGGSGIDFCAADVVLNTEGSGQSASGTCTDEAGNVSALATASGINIDKTAPTASASALPSPNVNGWNNSDVTVSWNWADNAGGSGIDAGNCPTSSTSSGEGTILLSASCKDLAGNEANASHTVKVDKTAPTASASALPAPNGNGWNNTNVTVSFSGSDVGGSGIDFCAADVVLNTEGSGQSASGTCTDEAGNVSALATASGINIDKTAPSLTWNGGPADGGSYYFGFVPAAGTCTAVDTLSGPDSCVVTGYGTGVGSHTLNATANDKAANTYSEQRSYTVLAWTLNGFFQPVDMNGVWNTVKNGSTVPLKFEIFAGQTELTSTSYVKSLNATQTPCSGGAVDDVEVVATGATVLRYDSTGGQFIYNWQTPKKPGFCYVVTMETLDGSKLQANFKLK